MTVVVRDVFSAFMPGTCTLTSIYHRSTRVGYGCGRSGSQRLEVSFYLPPER